MASSGDYMAYAKARVAAASNINVGEPGASIDGITLSAEDRVLLTRQTSTKENGVWVFATSGTAMSRPASPDQYATNNSLDNATVIWATEGDTRAGTVWGIDPAKIVIVDDNTLDPHDLTRVSLPPVQCRVATTEDIGIGGTHLVIDGTSVTDGAITNASGTLTCATTKPFRASDVGKRVIIAGAGAAAADLVAVITAYASEGEVTISPTASTTVSPADVTFGVAIEGNGAFGSDIVLVKDQAAREENGLYCANTSGAMIRCSEPIVPGRAMAVSEGVKNQHRRFSVATKGPITLDDTGIVIALQSLVLNPMDFGAVCDLATDDGEALQQTIDAAKTLGNNSGATVVIPSPGCFCERSIVVDSNILLTGQANAATSVIGTAPSKLLFDEGHCLILQARGTPTTRGEGATVRDLHVGTTAIAGITQWNYDQAYTVGKRVFMPWDRRYFYECLDAGTSQGHPAAAPEWEAGKPYVAARVPDFVTPPTASGANGHMYKCVEGGTSGATPPTHWINQTRWTDENGVVWECQPATNDVDHPEFHPDFPQNPIRYGATGSELEWQENTYYRTGDAVIARDAGDIIDDRVYVLEGASGTSGPTAGAVDWDVAVDDRVDDGRLTWRCKANTPLTLPLYMIRDNDVLWIACCCPAIAITCISSLERVYAFGATNACVHLQASGPTRTQDGPYPAANANCCRWNQVDCNGGALGVSVKGADGNAGVATAVTVIGNQTYPPEEWDVGIHDGTFFGWTWVGCRSEVANGYPFIANSGVGHSVFVGCYREVGINPKEYTPTPNRIHSGVVVGGVGMTLQAESTLDSAGPFLGNGYSFNLHTQDRTHETEHIEFQPAGSWPSKGLGMYAFSWQSPPEVQTQGIVWSNRFGAAFPSGWWAWAVQPYNAGATYVAFAVSGETADPRRDQASGMGELFIPNRPAAGIGSTPWTAGFYIGDPATPNRFQLGDGVPTVGDGTWLRGDWIWNVFPEFNGPSGWVCLENGPPDKWIPIPLTGDPQLSIDMGDGDVDLSTDPVSAANRMILLTDPLGGMTPRALLMPAPADEGHAYRRVIRNATTHDVVVQIGGGGTNVTVPTRENWDVGFDSSGAFAIV